jgi:hypothetical protein
MAPVTVTVTVPPVVIAVTAVVVGPGVRTPTLVVVRDVGTGHARRGGAGGSSTTKRHGDCRAERGNKAGKTHSDLLSQQTPQRLHGLNTATVSPDGAPQPAARPQRHSMR